MGRSDNLAAFEQLVLLALLSLGQFLSLLCTLLCTLTLEWLAMRLFG